MEDTNEDIATHEPYDEKVDNEITEPTITERMDEINSMTSDLKVMMNQVPGKCDCCGWDDSGFKHEPGCSVFENQAAEDVEKEAVRLAEEEDKNNH